MTASQGENSVAIDDEQLADNSTNSMDVVRILVLGIKMIGLKRNEKIMPCIVL